MEEDVVDEAQRVGNGNTPPVTAAKGRIHCRPPPRSSESASPKNISFDRNPFTSGTPAIAAAATIASSPV